jgi:hypothetical protein
MATAEQFQELLRVNAEYMNNLQARNQEQMQAMLAFFSGQGKGGKGGGRGGHDQQEGQSRDLDERKFREVGRFNGEEDKWKEWSMKFKGITKEIDPELFSMLKWSEEQQDEVTIEDAALEFRGVDAEGYSTKVYNRLMQYLTGPAFTIHQSVADENGLETWRRLTRRFNPLTPMRGLQLMLRIMVPGKIKKGQDVQTVVNKWEVGSIPWSGTTRRPSATWRGSASSSA